MVLWALKVFERRFSGWVGSRVCKMNWMGWELVVVVVVVGGTNIAWEGFEGCFFILFYFKRGSETGVWRRGFF